MNPGSISALDYASRISSLVYSIFILSLATVIYPALSRLSEDHGEFMRLLGRALRIALMAVLPMAAMFIVLRIPIVELLYQRGRFDAQDTLITSTVLAGLALGMCGMAFCELLNRAFYALKDTRTPMINGICVIIMNIIMNIILVHYMGILGIALGSSIAATFSAVMLLLRLRKKVGNIQGKWMANGFIKLLIASGFTAITVFWTEKLLVHTLHLTGSTFKLGVNITLASGIGAIVYLGIIFFLGMEELDDVIAFIGTRLPKTIKFRRISTQTRGA
ncbi:MAG: lipid II flippase MurJ [Syntrophomonas sp.]